MRLLESLSTNAHSYFRFLKLDYNLALVNYSWQFSFDEV